MIKHDIYTWWLTQAHQRDTDSSTRCLWSISVPFVLSYTRLGWLEERHCNTFLHTLAEYCALFDIIDSCRSSNVCTVVIDIVLHTFVPGVDRCRFYHWAMDVSCIPISLLYKRITKLKTLKVIWCKWEWIKFMYKCWIYEVESGLTYIGSTYWQKCSFSVDRACSHFVLYQDDTFWMWFDCCRTWHVQHWNWNSRLCLHTEPDNQPLSWLKLS
jgi:hypothetical protein